MALIKTIAEIRAVVPRISKLSDVANLPDMDKAAWKYIIPLIGQALYDDLNTKYNAETLSPTETALLKLIQRPMAAGALYDELPFMHTTITDNGIRTPETNSMRASQRWEYNYLKDGLKITIVEGQEMLLTYLYANKVSWPLWTASSEYAVFTSFLIRTGVEFSSFYRLKEDMRTFMSLHSIMNEVQENYLVSRLGRAMVAWLKDQTAVEITDNGATVDVLKIVKRALAHLTIKTACEQRQVIFTEMGFTMPATDAELKPVEGMTQADIHSIYIKREAADKEGQNSLSRAAAYIKGMGNALYGANPAGFDAAFANSPMYVAPGTEEEEFTNGNEYRKGVFRLGS